MKKYKAIICDIDGTLISEKTGRLPTERVTKAVKNANKIVPVGIATARPLFLIEDIVNQLQLTGPSIINGGAQVVDVKNESSFWEQPLLIKDLDKIFSRFKKIKIPILINDNGKDIRPSKTYLPNKPFSITTLPISDLQADIAIKAVEDIPTVSAHKFSWQAGKTMGVSINHVNATKQHAILEVAKALKIETHEIIGVGDSYNDFPLLMACGFKVAMGNAAGDLKAIADYIAPSVDDDGVADVIEKYIF